MLLLDFRQIQSIQLYFKSELSFREFLYLHIIVHQSTLAVTRMRLIAITLSFPSAIILRCAAYLVCVTGSFGLLFTRRPGSFSNELALDSSCCILSVHSCCHHANVRQWNSNSFPCCHQSWKPVRRHQ